MLFIICVHRLYGFTVDFGRALRKSALFNAENAGGGWTRKRKTSVVVIISTNKQYPPTGHFVRCAHAVCIVSQYYTVLILFFFFIALAGDESRLFDYVLYIRRPISGAQLRRTPYYYLEAVLSDVHATTREQKKRKI